MLCEYDWKILLLFWVETKHSMNLVSRNQTWFIGYVWIIKPKTSYFIERSRDSHSIMKLRFFFLKKLGFRISLYD